MATLVLSPSSTMPAAQTSAVPAIDIEWAPASAPGDAPSWRSMIGQPDGVQSLQTKVGRPQELQRFEAGTCSVSLENWKGLYDPDNAASPTAGMAVPNRQFRVVARMSGTTYYLFQGYLDAFGQPFGYPTPEPILSLNATDVFKLLARKSLPNSMYELAVAQDTPAHWWKLDEPANTAVAVDSGFGSSSMPGTYFGAPVSGDTAIVPYDGGRTSVNFAHVSPNRIDFHNAQPITSYPFTIEAWVKCASSPTELRTIYAASGGGAAYFLFAFDYTGDATTSGLGDSLTFYLIDAAVVPRRAVNTNAAIADGNAHHVVVVAASSSSFTLYVDGVAVPQTVTTSGAGTPTVTTGLMHSLGGYIDRSGIGLFGLDGNTSQLAVYSAALSATQVLDHYNAGKTAFLGEATGTRVGRVLDYLGLPAASRSVETGSSLLGSYDPPGGSGVDYVQSLADTEQGQWYGNGQGQLVWRARHSLTTDSRSKTSQATFSDAAAATLQYARLQFALDELNVYNDVTVTRSGGNDQRVQDATSRRKYFPQSFSISGSLQANDNDAADCARWILTHHADPPNRIIGLELEPLNDTTLFAQALGRQIGDRISVTRTIASVAFTSDFVIEGIEHNFTPVTGWLTVFRLSPAETQSYWIWDDAGTTWDGGQRWGF